jgi:small subunit ribosomal protein S8
MNTTDPIADFLTRIRNAINARRKRVDIPSSKLKLSITKMLMDQQYISGYSEIKDAKQNVIRINLRYTDGVNAIAGLRRVSRPGLRLYVPSTELDRVLGGMGIAIVSTSKGLMTDVQARTNRIGGEVMCHVW